MSGKRRGLQQVKDSWIGKRIHSSLESLTTLTNGLGTTPSPNLDIKRTGNFCLGLKSSVAMEEVQIHCMERLQIYKACGQGLLVPSRLGQVNTVE